MANQQSPYPPNPYKQQQPQFVGNQPGAMPMMDFRNPKHLSFDTKDGKREWANGFCSTGSCCKALWCPCCHYEEISERLDAVDKGMVEATSSNYGGPCVMFLLLCSIGFSCVLVGLQRARVREHYAIKGGCCGDYCGAAFCHPCVMSQMGEEIKDEEKARQGLA